MADLWSRWQEICARKSTLEWVGHIFFIGFTLWCALYYKERLLNNDAGYYTWHMVNFESPYIIHNRYINAITMALPILGMKLGMSLKSTLILYSSIFGLLYYTFFLISTYRWKHVEGGLYIALALVLAMRTKHYAGHTEITLAIAHASFLLAWITAPINRGNTKSEYYYHILIGILIIMYGIHPVIVMPLCMVLGFKMIYNYKWKNKDSWITIGLVLLTFGLKFLEVSFNEYESEKVSSLGNAMEVFTNSEDFYVWTILSKFFDTELHIPTIVFSLGCLYWLWQKRILLALYLLLCQFIILGVVVISHSYLQSDVYIMIDGYVGMLGMLWALPLIYIALSVQHLKWGVPLVIALLLFSSDRIIETGEFFTKRLQYYERTLYMYPDHKKLFVHGKFHHWEKLYYPYEAPMETLILTSIEGKEHSRTLFIDYEWRGDKALPKNDHTFFSFYGERVDLNKKFFTIPKEAYHSVDRVSWK